MIGANLGVRGCLAGTVVAFDGRVAVAAKKKTRGEYEET
jgi:hypothetical protein